MPSPQVAPAKGTRPRDRRELILAAAAELFAEHGSADVSMSDVARAVNVQPSALYRHFSGKKDLLREVVARGTQLRYEAVLSGASERIDEMLERLADSALASRMVTQLWSVEVRNVEPAVQAELRQQVRALPEALAQRLIAERSDLTDDQAQVLAWAALDVLASISFHDERLGSREFSRILADMTARVVATSVADAQEFLPARVLVVHPARRERLIAEAMRLFAQQGYAGVRLEDIASAADMSAAGVYTYVDGKSRLLELVMRRAADVLAHAHAEVLAQSASPAEALEALIETYVRFAWERPELLAVLLTELRHLDAQAQAEVTHTIADIDEVWVWLLDGIRPELDPVSARIHIRAVQMIAQDVLSTPNLRARKGVVPLVRAAMKAALDIG